METYVVHIHRRTHARAGPDALAGVVERTDAPVVRPFAGIAELLALLGIATRPAVAVARDRPSPRSKE
jgi:hypothetical protein